MRRSSRRDFLGKAALALPALGSWGLLAESAAPVGGRGGSAGHSVEAWQTSGTARCQRIAAPRRSAAAAVGAGDTIHLDAGTSRQQLLGFGAALTDASCFLLSQMSAAARASLLQDCFGPDGLGLSIARTTIGSSDYSRSAYTYDDAGQPDPALQHFTLEHDRAYILPALREVQQVNPQVFFFSSPWSPPAWMKSGNSLLGGMMEARAFPAYADYFVKFIQGYAAEGVRVQAVTVQNEIDTDQDGRMPQCLWGQEYEIKFVKGFLGPALRRQGLDTRIWILDHNYNLWGRVADEFEDPELSGFVDGVAWHGYYGEPDRMTRVHEMFPAKNAYWTEGGPDYTSPDYGTDWTAWSSKFAGILNNWSRSIVSWNLVLDEHGRPNIGPFSCGGLLTLDSRTRQVARSGMYWALMHHARFMRPGARILSTGAAGMTGVSRVAAENPDGSRVLVLTNAGREREVACVAGGDVHTLHLPGDSVTTLLSKS